MKLRSELGFSRENQPTAIPALLGSGRAADVRRMFAGVAPRYDLLNHVLSAGLDVWWRCRTTHLAPPRVPGPVVDLCTGTGDLAIAYARRTRRPVFGFDFCEPMIALGNRKLARRRLTERVRLAVGDALNVPLPDGSASVVCIAFGIRNLDSIAAGIREMARLVAPGGTVAVLEFSRPTAPIIGPLHLFYLRNIMPHIGRLFSPARTDAYRYLAESVVAFPEPEEMLESMRAAGLTDVRRHALTFGTVSLYVGRKPPQLPSID